MIESSQGTEPPLVPPGQTDGQPNASPSGPWGFWATVGLSLVIVAAYTLAQVFMVVVFTVAAFVRTKDFNAEEFAQGLVTNGFFWSLAICAAAPVTIGLTVLFAAIAKGITVRDYLGFEWKGWRVIGTWCLVQLLFVACIDGVAYLLHRPIVPAFMVDVYRSAYFLPLLWFAFVVVAPVTEEILIRGFLFLGIARSRLGPAAAIVFSAFAWSIMHTQYDVYGMAVIFAGGLVLGYARLRSRSLYVPLAMHMVQNVVATVEAAVYLSTASSPG